MCVNKSQFVPVIFEPPCTCRYMRRRNVNMACNGGMITNEVKPKNSKPVPVPRCLTQLLRGLASDRTQASAIRGRQVTARAAARRHVPSRMEFPAGVTLWRGCSLLCPSVLLSLFYGISERGQFRLLSNMSRLPIHDAFYIHSTPVMSNEY